MSIAEHLPATAPPESPDRDQRLLVHDVSWEMYEQLCQVFADHRMRFTYDRGEMEFMSPCPRRARYGYYLGCMVPVLAEELHRAIEPGGATTLRRPDVLRGIEGDHCFWIASEPQVRGKLDIDLTVDPPPDLFIEVEVTHSFLDRLAICAALGISEVWRFDERAIHVLLLQEDGTYAECDHSPTFPGIPIGELVRFLQPDPDQDFLGQLRGFREWVRQHIAQREEGT